MTPRRVSRGRLHDDLHGGGAVRAAGRDEEGAAADLVTFWLQDAAIKIGPALPSPMNLGYEGFWCQPRLRRPDVRFYGFGPQSAMNGLEPIR